MIPPHVEAEILRLFHAEKWRPNTIATQLGFHHSTVERVLFHSGVPREMLTARPTKVDPYLPFIRATLEKYPRLSAARLYEMVKARGYTGKPSHFREVISRLRPRRAAEAYLRLRTLPGEQAQVDWAHFGKVRVGNAERRLLAFVVVLSWSRRIFLKFYLGDAMPNFVRGHVDAFAAFGGVPREVLYDNLKSAVIERVGDAIRYNPTLLALSAHYRFKPQPVAVARGNEKGRVERAIQYIRTAFFAAREWKDLDDLNAQAEAWCRGPACERLVPGERSMSVGTAFALEQAQLLPLPDEPFPAEERVAVSVGKTPYVRFDGNDYSVPHTLVRRMLAVAATLDTVRILDGVTIVAAHPRSFSRGEQIEEAAHVEALVAAKRAASKARGLDRLHHAVPNCQAFISAAAERGCNLGGLVSGLLSLLDLYGPQAMQQAVSEALSAGSPHLAAVRQVLERRRRERKLGPPVPLDLPGDPRLERMVVVPQALDAYDALSGEEVNHG